MLVEHMGNTGTLTKSTVKFNKQLDENKTWAKSKEWFCDALDNIMEMQKYSGEGSGRQVRDYRRTRVDDIRSN